LLAGEGATRIDRSGSWHALMPELERRLFSAAATVLPEGEVLDMESARERMEAGAYDLVIIPPVAGEAPRLARIPDWPVVAWLEASGPLFTRSLPPWSHLVSDAKERFALGFSAHPKGLPSGSADASALLPWLGLRSSLRPMNARRRMSARLARANATSPASEWTEGLALHFAAQSESSPFDTPAWRVELDPAALDRLGRTAAAHPLSPSLRFVWESLASILSARREVELVHAYLAPLAAAHAPWPGLVLALAEADLESLDPRAARRRLDPLLSAEKTDPRVAWMYARALAAEDEHAAAADLLEKLRGTGLGWPAIERCLAIERFLAGASDAREALEQRLAAHPEDRMVERLLQEGGEADPFGPIDPWEPAEIGVGYD
jgi:hypothetical protein